MNISTSLPCDVCKGDGYLLASLDDWKKYQVWLKDPTPTKTSVQGNFPEFLKLLNRNYFFSITGEVVQIQCQGCGGRKTINKKISIDELKNLLK